MKALVLRSGEIICDPEHTDSHNQLIESSAATDYTKVYYEPRGSVFDLDKYSITAIDPPDWYNDVRSLESNLRDIVSRMIVNDERKLLLGGCWIIGKDAKINEIVNARVIATRGHINKVTNSRIDHVIDGKIVEVTGSTFILKMSGGKIDRLGHGARINWMAGGSIREVTDFATIHQMYGHVSILTMHASINMVKRLATIRTMEGSSQVFELAGTVNKMYDVTSIKRMTGTIGEISGNVVIETMDSQATISKIERGTVLGMFEESVVELMEGGTILHMNQSARVNKRTGGIVHIVRDNAFVADFEPKPIEAPGEQKC